MIAEAEHEEPLSKVYGEPHLDELQEDLQEILPERMDSSPVYRSCKMRVEQDGYVLGTDIEDMIGLSE